jgi:hypothetical protein
MIPYNMIPSTLKKAFPWIPFNIQTILKIPTFNTYFEDPSRSSTRGASRRRVRRGPCRAEASASRASETRYSFGDTHPTDGRPSFIQVGDPSSMPQTCAPCCGARGTARRGRGNIYQWPFPLQRIHNFALRGRGTPGLRQGHNAPCPPGAHRSALQCVVLERLDTSECSPPTVQQRPGTTARRTL